MLSEATKNSRDQVCRTSFKLTISTKYCNSLFNLLMQTSESPWHNPIAPAQLPGIEREACPFFQRVGACRYGDRCSSTYFTLQSLCLWHFSNLFFCSLIRCSRAHAYVERSCTLLFPGMYSHFELDQGLRDDMNSGTTSTPTPHTRPLSSPPISLLQLTLLCLIKILVWSLTKAKRTTHLSTSSMTSHLNSPNLVASLVLPYVATTSHI